MRKIRRSSRRRRYSGGGNLVKELISRDTLLLTGGAIASNMLTSIVTSRFGRMLPGLASGSNAAIILYSVGIPLVGAYFARRWSPTFAKGLVIGAAASGINAVAGNAIAQMTATLSGDASAVGAQAYLPPPQPGVNASLNTRSGSSVLSSLLSGRDAAFKTNAWS